MVVAWFIAFLVLLVIELLTVNLVSIWFVLGTLAALITTKFTDSAVIQTIVFVVVSFISLLLTRPIVSKFKNFRVEPTNSDRVIGKTGEVVKAIKRNEYGEVKVYGNTWTAFSEKAIKAGKKVRVLGIDGVKLIVKEEEE